MKLISVCVPCYNEEDNIENAYRAIVEVMESVSEYDFEIVFEDNDSTDRSQAILKELAGKDQRVKVIINSKNFGPNRSGTNCLLRSRGDAAVLIPCDLQDPPTAIPEFINAWKEEPCVVFGQRCGTEESAKMSKMRSLYYWFMNHVCGVKLYANVDGFGLYDRRVLNAAKSFFGDNRGMKLFVAESDCAVKLVPYEQKARAQGKSSYTIRTYFSLAFKTIIEGSNRLFGILRSFSAVVMLLAFIAFIGVSIYGCVANCFGVVGGYILCAVAVFFGAFQFFILSLIGQYQRSLQRHLYRLPLVFEKETFNMEDDR